jgi:plasmid maintenance system killer protein
LPEDIQTAADKAFQLLKRDARHPSLQFKKLSGSDYWSVRINDNYRALAVCSGDVWAWFWIGPHDEYNAIIKGK